MFGHACRIGLEVDCQQALRLSLFERPQRAWLKKPSGSRARQRQRQRLVSGSACFRLSLAGARTLRLVNRFMAAEEAGHEQ